MLDITNNAEKEFIRIMKNYPDQKIRFGVTGKGCNGFSYNLQLITEEELNSDDESLILNNGETIYIDGTAVIYILGTTIDYTDDAFGHHFVFSNPLATSSCGCGTSFGI